MSDTDPNPDPSFALVTFAWDDGDEAFLTLDTDWVQSLGMTPNVNVATVPSAEWEKIAQKPSSDAAGTVSFYFDDEDFPDVELEGITIVDVQGGRIGAVRNADGTTSATQWIDYKVSFADARAQLIPPRGGVLMDGDVNPEPLPPNMDADELLDNHDLLQKCLDASGLDYIIDGDFTVASPLRKLQWFGARAPDEIAKILQWCGGCLYTTADGYVGAGILGQGTAAPMIADEDLIANLPVPTFDRRGKTVVYVSAPTAAQEIHDGNDSSDDSPSWDWVARDTDGSWQTFDNNSILDGLDVDTEAGNGFADVEEQYRAQIAADVYHCIQLDTDDYDPRYASMLKQVATDDGYLNNLQATATIAYFSAQEGVYKNSQNDIQLTPTHVYGPDNVIRFAELLGTVDPSPTLDPIGNFESIDTSDITVTFAVESARKDGTGKSYFACGFTGDNGNAIAISVDEVTSALDGGGDDVVILYAPAARLLKTDSSSGSQGDNFSDLQSTCQKMAGRFLSNNTIDHRVIVARGFYDAELSGQVSEIRYSQSEAKTTITVNGWIHPSGAAQVSTSVASALVTNSARSGVASGGSIGGEAFPQQSVTQSDRASIGGSAANQPVHLIGAAPAPTQLRYDVAIEITGNETGQGIYDGHWTDPPLKPDLSSGVVIDFTNGGSGTNKAVILNIGETSGGNTAGSGGSHAIASETKLFGMRGPTISGGAADGKTIVWTYYDPNCFRSFQVIARSGVAVLQGSPMGSMKNPPAKSDASWLDIIVGAPCDEEDDG